MWANYATKTIFFNIDKSTVCSLVNEYYNNVLSHDPKGFEIVKKCLKRYCKVLKEIKILIAKLCGRL